MDAEKYGGWARPHWYRPGRG